MTYNFRENADLMGFIGQLIANDYTVTIRPERLGYSVEVDDGAINAQGHTGHIGADRGDLHTDG